jgi:hypothetical protein
MRLILATALIAGGLLAGGPPGAARAEPDTCPPDCDRIPDTAWIAPAAIPLNSTYHWPAPAGVAVPMTGGAPPEFRFEEVCATPVSAQDPRSSAVSGRATVNQPAGEWQLLAQVMHWRGDTSRGGQNATSVFDRAAAALRGCQLSTPTESPSVTVDEPNRLAAVIAGPLIVHTYLVAHPENSTISELAIWAADPVGVPWPIISDAAVLEAMSAPMCAAYLGSC